MVTGLAISNRARGSRIVDQITTRFAADAVTTRVLFRQPTETGVPGIAVDTVATGFCIMMQSRYALMYEDDDFHPGFAFAKGEEDFA